MKFSIRDLLWLTAVAADWGDVRSATIGGVLGLLLKGLARSVFVPRIPRRDHGFLLDVRVGAIASVK